MLFQSTVRMEVARTFGATLVVLATVVMTMTMIRLLGQATRGRVNPEDVSLVLLYTVLSYTPTLLAMSLFIAVVAALSRMHQDGEMAVWHNSGRGLASFTKPIFQFAWPVFVLTALLSFVVLPWTNLQVDELRQRYESRGDIQRIERGLFTSSADGSKIFFIDKSSAQAETGSNVFISSSERGKKTVTTAESGRTTIIDAVKDLVLEPGQRLEIDPRKQSIKVSDFQSYEFKVADVLPDGISTVNLESTPTLDLLRRGDPPAWGELSWRAGLVLAALNLAVVGICLSRVNPRSGKSLNVVGAIFLFITYFNLIGLGQTWISTGRTTAWWYMLMLHGGVGALTWLWLTKIHQNWFINLRRRSIRQAADHASQA